MDRKSFSVISAVTIINPWIWKIISGDLLLALLLIFLSLSLYLAIFLKENNHSYKYLTAVLVISVSAIVFLNAFDRNLFIPSSEEILRQDSKHLYFSHNLGKIYLNRAGLYFHQNLDLPLYKLQSNFFSNLDPNLYFFAGHPRERAGVGDFEKYLFLSLPFFITGIITAVQKKLKLVAYYFILAATAGALIRPDYIFGPVLFFPLINVFISIGIIYFLSLIRRT